MRRTEWLQETRRMRFEEADGKPSDAGGGGARHGEVAGTVGTAREVADDGDVGEAVGSTSRALRS